MTHLTSKEMRITVAKTALKQVLDGNVGRLVSSFTWEFTPQGYKYWQERSVGLVPLSAADIEFLRSLMGEPTRAPAPVQPRYASAFDQIKGVL